MAKHLATPDPSGTQSESGLLADIGREQSEFFKTVEGKYGSVMGHSVALSAERNLRAFGIDARELKRMTQQGRNTILFTLRGKLAVKVLEELETYRQTPLGDNPLVLKPLARANIGFDMGGVPITLEVVPQLNTQGVEPRHVRALSHELFAKHGLTFVDNKIENVGLTREGLPYVIDSGSLVPAHGAAPRPDDFLYPELSGYNFERRSWDGDAAHHAFTWPESQKNIFEFRAAAALMKPQRSVSAIS